MTAPEAASTPEPEPAPTPVPDGDDIWRASSRALKVMETCATILAGIADPAAIRVDDRTVEEVEWTMRTAARRLRKLLGSS